MDIDDAVRSYFSSPPAGVDLRCDSIAAARRKLLSNGTIAMYDEEHWKHKRGHSPRAPDPIDMKKPFDGSRFNFNKVGPQELITKVQLRSSLHPMLVNISPLMVGHTLVALWAEQGVAQGELGVEGVHAMVEFARLSSSSDFRVAYNSLGAFASVNHLHVHGLYAAALDGKTATCRFPIESAHREQFALTTGHTRVSTISADARTGPLVNAIAFEGGETGVAEAAGQCIAALASLGVPHNLLVRVLPTPMCILIPRQPQEKFDVATAGCNAAVCEAAGFLVMQSATSYDALTAESAHAAFEDGASLDASAFGALLERLSDTLGWRQRRRSSFAMTLSCAASGGGLGVAKAAHVAAAVAVLALAVALARRWR